MYPSVHDNHYEKPPPPSAPPAADYGGYGQTPVTGIPVSAPTYVYTNTVPAPPPQLQAMNQGTWSTGLCDCSSDLPNCCVTCWCPCITFGQIAEIVDRGSTTCGASGALYALIFHCSGMACLYSCVYRSRLRQQYNIPERPCADCLVHFCCESCALCQEYRELRNRGFDMSLGWEGNVEKQTHGVTKAPFAQQGMDR